eukprot:Phypoly_transcript_20646.p1 GENE.Phypoly_transcript_20646~~Phypoly_transcript_20646.p1  ORF type:complete len:207 (+),score=67.00 Phypoly_transcript_20646:47-667(+)
MSKVPFKYPEGFDAVAGEFFMFQRPELKEFAEKFNTFDEDGNGYIDFFELKRAQEKMGDPKTHTELTQIMESMAADPKKGITFRDFTLVQARIKGVDLKGIEFGKSSFLPVAEAFVKACNDFSVTGIKSFHEQKFAAQQAEIEREKKIKEQLDTRKKAQEEKRLAVERAKQDREREEREKIEAEKKREEDRKAFKARQAALFENKS